MSGLTFEGLTSTFYSVLQTHCLFSKQETMCAHINKTAIIDRSVIMKSWHKKDDTNDSGDYHRVGTTKGSQLSATNTPNKLLTSPLSSFIKSAGNAYLMDYLISE